MAALRRLFAGALTRTSRCSSSSFVAQRFSRTIYSNMSMTRALAAMVAPLITAIPATSILVRPFSSTSDVSAAESDDVAGQSGFSAQQRKLIASIIDFSGPKDPIDEAMREDILDALTIHPCDVEFLRSSLDADQMADLGTMMFELAIEQANRDQISTADMEKMIQTAGMLYKEGAALGNISALYNYASFLLNGIGMTPDPQKAVRTFSLAANTGHSISQFVLACLYMDGTGVEKNFETASDLLKKSFAGGYAESYHVLGMAYLNGEAVQKDAVKAVGYLEAASTKGSSDAQALLGKVYLKGDEGVPQNLKRSFDLKKEVAEKTGEPLHQHNLALMYTAGQGCEADLGKAKDYFERAAMQGFVYSMINLGNMYRLGLHAEKNLSKAKEWYIKAVATEEGKEIARPLLEELEDEMNKN